MILDYHCLFLAPLDADYSQWTISRQSKTLAADDEKDRNDSVSRFVIAVWREKAGDAIGAGDDESDEALA